MALQPVGAFQFGFASGFGGPLRIGINQSAIDAVGESTAFVGRIQLTSGQGTSKTFDNTCSISMQCSGTVNWLDPTTVVRVGIQNVNPATGVEDGTWLVYADVSPGGSVSFASGAFTVVPMTTGSTTVTHNQWIAVVTEMLTRGGTDVVRPVYSPTTNATHPYVTIDTGSGPIRTSALPAMLMKFGDATATYGHFGEITIPIIGLDTIINDSTQNIEYALVFEVPFACRVSALTAECGEFDPNEVLNLTIYSDPYGTTPTVMRATSLQGAYSAMIASVTGLLQIPIEPVELQPNTTYAIGLKHTGSSASLVRRLTFPSVLTDPSVVTWHGMPLTGATRSGASSGAFTSYSGDLPSMGFVISHMDDGVVDGVTSRPNSTVAAGTWTPVGAATIHQAVNDANDTTLIRSSSGTDIDTVRLGFASYSPGAGTMTIYIRTGATS